MQAQHSIQETTERLERLCNIIPPLLLQIPDNTFSHKPAPGKWSKKEILGHLVDSAANNHQRFIRGQFEDVPFIIYAQDEWNAASHYNDMTGVHVILFWEMYNRHITEVLRRISPEKLQRKCLTNEPEPVTLLWLAEDYVKHMEYHLRQIVAYE